MRLRSGAPTLPKLGVLVVMVLWAANFIVVKAAVAVLPPIGFTFLRFVLAALTLMVLLRWREGSIGMPRRDLVTMLALGGLGFGVYQMLWTTGLTTVAAGDSALIIAATPVLVAVLAVVAGSDVLTPLKLAGALISFVGVAIVIASGPGLSIGGSLVGEADHLRRGACWVDLHGIRRAVPAAAFAVAGDGLGHRRRDRVPRPGRHRPACDRPTGRRSRLEVGGAILYSGFLAAGFSNVVVQHGVKIIGPTRTSTLPVPRSGPRRRAGGGFPVRASPPGPDRRRRRHRRRDRPAFGSRAAGSRRPSADDRRTARRSRRCSPARSRSPSSSTTTGRSP